MDENDIYDEAVSENTADAEAPGEEAPAEIIEEKTEHKDEIPAEEPVEVIEEIPSNLPSKPNQDAINSAVTVYTPYIPEGPSVTSLEKAAAEARKALARQKTLDKKRLRRWKKDARGKAKRYLNTLKAAPDAAERRAIKRNLKAEKHAWAKSIKSLDKSEKVLQKKAYKAFRKRVTRTRRIVSFFIILALIAGLCYAALPVIENLSPVLKAQYTLNSDEASAARAAGIALSEKISDEGIVLLKNENNVLPLQARRLNVFGSDSYEICCGENVENGATLFEGLEKAGISYNLDLHSAYIQAGFYKKPVKLFSKLGSLFNSNANKKAADETSFLKDGIIANAKAYSDQALITLAPDTPLGKDIPVNGLAIGAEKLELLKLVDRNFEHVIIVINSANPMELGDLNGFEHIDAIIWAGIPGPQGCISLGKILTGAVNPSGRLPDTWAYSASSAPAAVNFTSDRNRFLYSSTDKNYLQYEEGIYVGYRYYETRYEGDEEGYSKAVAYPFGYGLSYTDFDWETLSFKATDSSITWRVKVTNTGDAEGQDVLELYFSPPYSEDSSAEKSAIALAAYGKTKLLAPNESQVLTLSFRPRDMASYSEKNCAYILDGGTYKISIGRNVHDLSDTREYEIKEQIKFTSDEKTDTTYSTVFDFADGSLTYLSRGDWVGTYPKGLSGEPCEATLKADVKAYNSPEASDAAMPENDANNGIKLADLKGLDYNDEKWDKFLDQFTMEELYDVFSQGGWHTVGVPRLGVPETAILGESSGIYSEFVSIDSVKYPAEITLAAAWSSSLAKAFGEAIGAEAAAYGINAWYAPNLNLHRSAFGGNNYKTYSEDPLLTGKTASDTIKGVQSRGVVAIIGKLGLYNEISLTDAGLYIWADEQAIRELYLKPFEIAVKEGRAHGIMTAKTHLGYKWSGACPELLEKILRGEWGFEGVVTTDTVNRAFMDSSLAARRGTSLMLETGFMASERVVKRAYINDSSGIANGIRRGVHDLCYTIVNYMGGIS